ncbi:tRNA uridine-5-carboxymethylaminomethyl(34) synthesis GTPase MnmE [Candidatus Sumerlaeota bacterium]|nr:tRNA uridine-5-carboxymethylaminomethyl(34) synthesis GTPase MnmE [Candidatus Sumerlaeota bacterium]
MMNNNNSMETKTDTITARSTPGGEGAIAIIRLSGLSSFEIIRRCFYPYKEPKVKFNYMTLGKFIDPQNGAVIDEVFVVLFENPSSYTGEDAAEIHCHGSPCVTSKIIETLCNMGARLAEPGEFTKRAFLNGKMDLTKAEAVCDLIRAQTEKAANLALKQLQGELYQKIKSVKDVIITVGSELEARLDFPDEDTVIQNNEKVLKLLGETKGEIERLIHQGRNARIYRNGARIAILGKPNTGKSSLFNVLLRMERAIVTPHPGTTRDSIECTVNLKGCPVTYIDTAGIHYTNNQVELLGIERARKEISQADLNLILIDGSLPLTEEDFHIFQIVAENPCILVLNKFDLDQRVQEKDMPDIKNKAICMVHTSAMKGYGIKALETAIKDFLISETGMEDSLVTNERHLANLTKSRDALKNALDALRKGVAEELVMVDLRESIHYLAIITGEETDDEILDKIFRRFCIGK